MTAAELAALLRECADEVQAYGRRSSPQPPMNDADWLNFWRESADMVLSDLMPSETQMRAFAHWLETRHGTK